MAKIVRISHLKLQACGCHGVEFPTMARAGVVNGSDCVDDAQADAIVLCAPDEEIGVAVEAAIAIGGYPVAFACVSHDELLARVSEAAPAVVVLGHKFEPFDSALELLRLCSALAPVPVVVVAGGFLGAAARKLVASGADGFVHVSEIDHALAPAIGAVLAGQLCVPASMHDWLAQPVFSHREKQVLELVAEGRTNAQIAAELFLSESTVKSHLATSFRKLGVSSRTEAVRCLAAPDAGVELLRPRNLADQLA